MIIDREVSTVIMIILIVTFDKGNQYRMRRDSQQPFKCIQFLGSVMILYIKITVIVIVNEIQTVVLRFLCAGCTG